MFRQIWFQLHWLLGITAGLVLAVVGVTGALLSFEPQIIAALNPQVVRVTPAGTGPLSPDALLARIAEQAPARQVNWLGLNGDPGSAARVNFADGGRRGTTEYVDPYRGELLGQTRGNEFFLQVMRLHRWLLAGDIGKQVVGASTLALLVLAASGLYLRWPRRLTDWRAWFTFSFQRRGRGFLWDMHAAIGTWVLPLYLLAALTGLYWSYGWYRDGLYALSGAERPVRGAPGGGAEAGPARDALRGLDGGWQAFIEQAGGYSEARLMVPKQAGQALRISYLDAEPDHERAGNQMVIAADGRVLSHQRYADKPLNERLMGSMLPLHSGSYFGLPGLILMMLASLLIPLFTITGWMLYLDRRRKKAERRTAERAAGIKGPDTGEKPVLVAFASQSGGAERQAWLSAGALRAAGVPATVRPLGGLRPEELAGFERALFALATFGDGEPPDNATAFARRMSRAAPSLQGLRFGLLALGDSAYERYCGFGREVADWLRRQGAQALFEPVEVDAGDQRALAQWRTRLAALGAGPDVRTWAETPLRPWRLLERRELNPGSQGEPVFHLRLEAPAGEPPVWQAGDLAEIAVQRDGEEPLLRRYSIASIPADGVLALLVRRMRHPDGRPGAGSGLLTETLAPGDSLPLRILANRGFHAPAESCPVLLIGNGTGLAGLRAHLRARAAVGEGRNWLIFGERQAAFDFHYREELRSWQSHGLLQRLDAVFSRDQAQKRYVQHALAEQGERLRHWVDEGAAIYVCGSLQGMAPAVDAVLREQLGEQALAALQEAGRYRRDVY